MNKKILIVAAIMLAVGVGAGYWFASRTSSVSGQRSQIKDVKQQERKILFYRNMVNPSVISKVPAKDAMGMDYVPVYADSDTDENRAPAGQVIIDPVTVQNIGVRTAIAEEKTLSHIIRAMGRVDFDEERMVRLHPKTEGWIQKLVVDKTGQWTKKGTELLAIYSPQLVSSQQEYLLALNNLKALEESPFKDIRQGAENLVKSSRERLKLLDVPEHQILKLEKTRSIMEGLHIHTPASGIVMKIGVREGQFVTPATELYMIADLSQVWVYAEIYEYELPWVQIGDTAKIQLSGIPGRQFEGRLDYIYPYAESKTRTIKARLVFDNPEKLLKPNMFAEVTIYAGRKIDSVVIPDAAIVRSGTRAQVFVVRGAGKFEPRMVKLGIVSEGQVQVLEGLHAGEEIVTSAQFLIDSESKLREATAKMLEPSKKTQTQSLTGSKHD
ncbi:MAG: efflux RND transporter periplasmic adaptor subunit [Nitrosomonadales bacterium]|nr:MAG: efflux RND transporter periplasmic adaptor subunit [Nitrosomonadales bacterium]